MEIALTSDHRHDGTVKYSLFGQHRAYGGRGCWPQKISSHLFHFRTIRYMFHLLDLTMSSLAIFVFINLLIVTGSLMSYWFNSAHSVGASGAIFGLVCPSVHLLPRTLWKYFCCPQYKNHVCLSLYCFLIQQEHDIIIKQPHSLLAYDFCFVLCFLKTTPLCRDRMKIVTFNMNLSFQRCLLIVERSLCPAKVQRLYQEISTSECKICLALLKSPVAAIYNNIRSKQPAIAPLQHLYRF